MKLHLLCYKEFATKHAFNDGNKRIAHMVAQMFLAFYMLTLDIDYKNAENFIIYIAKDEKSIQEIKIWIKSHLRNLQVHNFKN